MADEREVEHEPQVLQGEDDIPRQPTSQRDPFIPEPGARPGEQKAFRILPLAFIAIGIAVVIVIVAAVR